MDQPITIYWAGRLFNQAEFLWNKYCVEKLRSYGYTVISPQEDAEKFKQEDGSYDLDALAEDCERNSTNADVGIYNLDGPDVDSGTAFEAGVKVGSLRIARHSIAIGVRTDFRGQSEDTKTGVNAMFRRLGTIVNYPKLDDPDGLCQLIHETIQRIFSGNNGSASEEKTPRRAAKDDELYYY